MIPALDGHNGMVIETEAAWSSNMTMPDKYKLAEAKSHFSEIAQKVMLGESVVVTKKNRPVVRIVAIKPLRRDPGIGKGIWMAPDFDEPLADFAEYI